MSLPDFHSSLNCECAHNRFRTDACTCDPSQSREENGSSCITPELRQDLRSKIAVGRDEFLSSPVGVHLVQTSGGDKYARNRIEAAWLAGVDWALRNPQETVPE